LYVGHLGPGSQPLVPHGEQKRWLLANPGSPHADEIRARADAHRSAWLRGWRDVLGFAYLTLVVP